MKRLISSGNAVEPRLVVEFGRRRKAEIQSCSANYSATRLLASSAHLLLHQTHSQVKADPNMSRLRSTNPDGLRSLPTLRQKG